MPLAWESPSTTTTHIKKKRKRKRMWLVFICNEEEKEVGRQEAPGCCPYCGGKVQSSDVEIRWSLCFLPMCFNLKRKYFCTLCARRLELYY
ncbi:uncharacterized protein G2W53_006451 [Senna tora]|uniref:Uncharacterized protein n=1 Tax=Senna tora TaxID=362788 RepID=A0A834X4Q0_9FABA|nr:uncharacterized protein G2W53_006451 [Senna tora]